MTSPDLVLAPADQRTPPAALLQSPAAQPLDSALFEMHSLLEQHGHLIAVYPASIAPAHEQRLHMVRSVLESDRIVLLKSSLPPLGTAILALQLRQLTLGGFSPGVIASAARLLPHYIHAGAVLNSVTKLDRVPVSLKSHAKSWLPGTQFGVLAHPEPQLVKIGAGQLKGPEFASHLLVANGQLQTDWVTATLAPGWQVQAVHETPLPADSAHWWGTGKLVEFASYLPDANVIHQLVASAWRVQCHWCGMELIGDRCGFCNSPLPSASTGSTPVQENQTGGSGVLSQGTRARHRG
ncbi:hypothetical protein ACFXOD_14260 [Streptomyces sp. NPDC059161]|uniref:hypothetical protein n=1 Tax=Streptomyces sp. NPDC059161 TaxID=3346749 RepID=UPI00368C2892